MGAEDHPEATNPPVAAVTPAAQTSATRNAASTAAGALATSMPSRAFNAASNGMPTPAASMTAAKPTQVVLMLAPHEALNCRTILRHSREWQKTRRGCE